MGGARQRKQKIGEGEKKIFSKGKTQAPTHLLQKKSKTCLVRIKNPNTDHVAVETCIRGKAPPLLLLLRPPSLLFRHRQTLILSLARGTVSPTTSPRHTPTPSKTSDKRTPRRNIPSPILQNKPPISTPTRPTICKAGFPPLSPLFLLLRLPLPPKTMSTPPVRHFNHRYTAPLCRHALPPVDYFEKDAFCLHGKPNTCREEEEENTRRR